jgi:3-hydroxyisobutyrate dehydrogenase-like beta-hydroxyacid dehydrogenase
MASKRNRNGMRATVTHRNPAAPKRLAKNGAIQLAHAAE